MEGEGDGARRREEGRLLTLVVSTVSLGDAATDRELVLSITLSALLRPEVHFDDSSSSLLLVNEDVRVGAFCPPPSVGEVVSALFVFVVVVVAVVALFTFDEASFVVVLLSAAPPFVAAFASLAAPAVLSTALVDVRAVWREKARL